MSLRRDKVTVDEDGLNLDLSLPPESPPLKYGALNTGDSGDTNVSSSDNNKENTNENIPSSVENQGGSAPLPPPPPPLSQLLGSTTTVKTSSSSSLSSTTSPLSNDVDTSSPLPPPSLTTDLSTLLRNATLKPTESRQRSSSSKTPQLVRAPTINMGAELRDVLKKRRSLRLSKAAVSKFQRNPFD